jgi:hypothetical protein
MIDQKHPENTEIFNSSSNLMINHARFTLELKLKIDMAQAAISKKKTLFTSKPGLNLRKNLVKCHTLSTYLNGNEPSDSLENITEIS